MTIRQIPVASLDISERNLRRTGSSHSLEALKADIAAHGVLQNLVAIPAAGKRKGRYEVTAGGRRLAAARALIADGLWPEDATVPVLVLDTGEGTEASLAENFQRLGMNPADECLAFRHLVEVEGKDPATVAARFGLTRRFVEGRLRLAHLAEPVFEALRDGRISLDVAQAFGTSGNRSRQEQIWEEAQRAPWMLTPERIRSAMRQDEIRADSPIARFVGEQAYLDAGGAIDEDLFGDDAERIWVDRDLALQLATERLREAAEATRAAEGFATVIPALDGVQRPEGMVPVFAQRRPLTSEELARMEALEREVAELETGVGEDEDLPEHIQTRLDEIDAERDAILSGCMTYTPEDKARATAFLVLDRNGQPEMYHTIYAPLRSPEPQQPAPDTWTTTIPEPERDRSTNDNDPSAAGEADGMARPRLSQALTDALLNDRATLLQLALAEDPLVALDALAFGLALEEIEPEWYLGEAFGVVLREQWLGGASGPSEGLAARLTKVRNRLPTDWARERGIAAKFAAFRNLAPTDRAAWLAWCFAKTIRRHPPGRLAFHEHLAALVEVRPEREWRPTAANYFGRVPKSVILDTLAEVGGPELRSRYANLKKGELAEAAERVFDGRAIIEPAARAAATSWVPPLLRFSPCDGPSPDEEPADGEGSEPDNHEGEEDADAVGQRGPDDANTEVD